MRSQWSWARRHEYSTTVRFPVSTISASDPVARRQLLIFAKYPRSGQVKTRLSPPLDPGDASRLYRAFLLDALDLYDDVLSIGLEFDVGSGGKRLTGVQRQKLNLARALLKRSDYFIFNRPIPALDQRIQDQITHNIIEGLHKEGKRPAIIWVLSNAKLAEIFDRILLFDRGDLAEAGNYPELSEKNGMFKELLS